MQMAQAAQEKGRGLKFAEQQLLRHGWEHGKGLGRAENGISEAIKVKVKCDKGGVGHKEGEQFTFHWWDHVFNKASSSLQVESDQKGIALKKTTEEAEEEDGISNKKPRKASLAKAKLYGCFVKSATLLSGHEQPEPKSSNSEDSSSSEEEEDDQTLDLSSTTKLSDAALMKACGGRTAHKGARHGLTMSAKLARLEQQEAEFMAKYGKKSQPASASLACVTSAPSAEPREERQEGVAEDTGSKKVKKKTFTGSRNELSGVEASQSAETQIKPKKKKKKKRDDGEAEKVTEAVSMEEEEEEDGTCVDNSETDHSHKTTRKHKKKRNKAEPREDDGPPATEINGLEPKAETHTDTKGKKKKKKKSSKRRSEEEESNNTEASQSEQRDAADSCTEEKQEEATVKQKRKKCKKDKLSIDEQEDEEALLPKRKKKKSKD